MRRPRRGYFDAVRDTRLAQVLKQELTELDRQLEVLRKKRDAVLQCLDTLTVMSPPAMSLQARPRLVLVKR